MKENFSQFLKKYLKKLNNSILQANIKNMELASKEIIKK